MKINKKSHVPDDSSSFTRLPDEMVLQIICKIIDFKTLCLCELVSKRFRRIVHQVETICFTSFTYPIAFPPIKEVIPSDTLASLGSYWSAIMCLKKFGRMKSLRIQVPSSFDNNHLLFKWKIKFGNRVDSFIYVSPNSVYHDKQLYVKANGHQEDEAEDLETYKTDGIAFQCLKDVFVRIWLLMNPIINLPLLEDVTITDSGQRGKISLSGKKVVKMRNLIHSISEAELNKYYLDLPCRISLCYVPLLELPVSGYVMKGVTLYLFDKNDLLGENIDSCMNIDLNDSEDTEEAAYSEAVMEILKKHRTRFERFT
ncbi:F-box domain, Leucine-rich repeat domain, L domain-like protein [Artemisia annua]|uniref:F-box domain, Leucine-rich repeat domain, L domain-like protein n=1 Tax=Artemisia annua TaxID=35608 RepID=A0A2U1MMV8_ARTAN|nr:F-box domain, Leucine-rich repeat domain, L domain-like protein [Artemisia annua]